MDIKALSETAPWDWPEDAGETFLAVLADRKADETDRLLAAGMAGNACAVNDDLAAALIAILGAADEPARLRERCAIALGPSLEQSDTYGFDDPDDAFISEEMFGRAREALELAYRDEGAPRDVRRRALEASVRAPADWHAAAIREAYASDDEKWRLTAVFCMQYVKGFDAETVAAISSDSEDVRCEALRAVAAHGVKKAWPGVAAILEQDSPPRGVLLAAIDAAASIGTAKAFEALERVTLDADDEVVAAVTEAMAMAGLDIDEALYDSEDDEGDDDDVEGDGDPEFPLHLLQ